MFLLISYQRWWMVKTDPKHSAEQKTIRLLLLHTTRHSRPNISATFCTKDAFDCDLQTRQVFKLVDYGTWDSILSSREILSL